MDLLVLYDEILYKIILAIHNPNINPVWWNNSDRINLFHIMITCARLRNIIYIRWNEIVDYYTIKIETNSVLYYFCGRLHRGDDRPALILDDTMGIRSSKFTIWKWYRHGRLHRDGNKPAVIREYEGTCEYYHNGYITCVKTLTRELLAETISIK